MTHTRQEMTFSRLALVACCKASARSRSRRLRSLMSYQPSSIPLWRHTAVTVSRQPLGDFAAPLYHYCTVGKLGLHIADGRYAFLLADGGNNRISRGKLLQGMPNHLLLR